MNHYKVTFFGRESGAIGIAYDISIEVQTPCNIALGEDCAIRDPKLIAQLNKVQEIGKAINGAGFEYNYIKEIEKI